MGKEVWYLAKNTLYTWHSLTSDLCFGKISVDSETTVILGNLYHVHWTFFLRKTSEYMINQTTNHTLLKLIQVRVTSFVNNSIWSREKYFTSFLNLKANPTVIFLKLKTEKNYNKCWPVLVLRCDSMFWFFTLLTENIAQLLYFYKFSYWKVIRT